VTAPAPIPADRFEDGQDFLQEVMDKPDALVYFLCNVGDGDAQLLLLPKDEAGNPRQAVVVDAAVTKKLPTLLNKLHETPDVFSLDLGPNGEEPLALIVATHPHQDHINGMQELLQEHGAKVAEFWDPGFFHSVPAYHGMMQEIEKLEHLLYAQPTSGFRRWIGDTEVSVLSPSVHLRNRFDSYGTEINDSSISLRIEFPTHRYLLKQGEDPAHAHEEGEPIDVRTSRSLILGADAQTLSWSYVLTDFPFLRKSDTPTAKAIAAATGDVDLLSGDVLKVSHHASKHGVNLELVERIAPTLTLVSSVAEGGKYNFPHSVAQDLIREALEPSTSKTNFTRGPDYELNMFYTSDTCKENGGEPTTLGSIAIVMNLKEITLWRFCDTSREAVDFTKARKWGKAFR
jgi:hypothetical protein